MTEIDRVARAFYRQSLPCFVERVFRTLEPEKTYRHNWHIDHICWQLSRVARGEIKRLIINVPPRSMKSITVTVGFTAWILGRDPTKRIIAVSYADELARKLAIDTGSVMESDWYRQLFPALQPRSTVQRRHEFVTSAHGYRFASGVGGAVLGRGGDLIVIDDPIKALDALSEAERRRVWEFYIGTLCTRLDDKQNGAIVIVMQRLHADDLVGRILDLEGEIWEVVSIPAIADEDKAFQLSDDPEDVYLRRAGEVLHDAREPMSVLEAIRRAQGSLNFSAQYQQAPVPPGGNVIKRDWLRSYTTPPARFDRVVISWDTASTLSETSDWSVGTVWGARWPRFLSPRGVSRATGIAGSAPGDHQIASAAPGFCDADRTDRTRPGFGAGPLPDPPFAGDHPAPGRGQTGAAFGASGTFRGRTSAFARKCAMARDLFDRALGISQCAA